MEPIKGLVGQGVIHSREDIIRFLCSEGFDIPEASEGSITLSTPDEPGNTGPLRRWLFCDRIRPGRDKHFTGDDLPISAPIKTDKEAGA